LPSHSRFQQQLFNLGEKRSLILVLPTIQTHRQKSFMTLTMDQHFNVRYSNGQISKPEAAAASIK